MKPYDNAANLLANTGALSLCRWLGEPTNRPRLIAAKLASSTVDPDLVVELAPKVALHVEFQTKGERNFGLRMLEYTSRLRRQPELAGYSLRHQVVVLGDGNVEDQVRDEGLRFHFHVRYLREEEPGPLLTDPVLAPLAPLADMPSAQRPSVLRRAARIVLADGRPELLRATRDLAHIRLASGIIDEVWKELPMPIPTSEYYRYKEGEAEGAVRTIATALRDRFGDDRRIDEIARKLAAEPERWFTRVLAAASLDDLV